MDPILNIPQEIPQILGLTDSEKKILAVIAKFGLGTSTISRRTGISRTSLLYILNKLYERRLVFPIIYSKTMKHWRSDLRRALRQLNLYSKHKSLGTSKYG
ncbi:MAG: MarR family transcriptional regulator [Candidatus Paceibacterota bacterium]